MILFFQWNSFLNKGIEKALTTLGKEYQTYFYNFTDWEKDAFFEEDFRRLLLNSSYECVFSVNFSPLISNLCEEKGIPYVSWIYDSPIHIRNLSTLSNSVNHAYFFDLGQTNNYLNQGIPAKYMPLGVDPDVFSPYMKSHLSPTPKKISLVGQLYQTYYNYYVSPLESYNKGYLEGILGAQSKLYGGYLLPELVTDSLVTQINEDYVKHTSGNLSITKEELLYMLACEVTGRERFLSLALLSKYFPVELYSHDKVDGLEQVSFKGYADYYTQMPDIFFSSTINLNISLKTIQTGIPLRVLDVIGCHGFLISNYQAEMADYFKLDEEIVVYENIEDLFAKTKFYMIHESERQKIMEKGFARIQSAFSISDKIEKMLQQI